MAAQVWAERHNPATAMIRKTKTATHRRIMPDLPKAVDGAVKRLAAGAGSAAWTAKKPTNPGWYWVRSLPKHAEQIIRFEDAGGERDGAIKPTTGDLSAHGWKEFSGPIPPPTSQRWHPPTLN